VRTLRGLEDRGLRRARLLAARTRKAGTVTWRGIFSGQWDTGSVVRAFLNEGNPSKQKET
jgi:hypothetical protein